MTNQITDTGIRVGRDLRIPGTRERCRIHACTGRRAGTPLLLAAGAVALLAAGCGRGHTDPAAAAPPRAAALVQAVTAEQRDLSRTLAYTGSVEPVKAARMASPAEGPIVECPVREGDSVRKGQVLARVGRSRIAETGLEAAREELRRQEAESARVEQLVRSGSLPGEQMDAARANLKRAEAQVAAMETGAGDYEIEAPWDGVVSHVWIAEGNYVSPRAPLVELFDPDSLVVRIAVPEQQALAVDIGQPVHVRLDAHPGRVFAGTITRVYPELERTTRTLTAEVNLTDAPRLLTGMFARVDVTVETAKNAIVVPESALVVLPDGQTVAYVVEGELAVQRRVTTGLEAGGAVAVADGIRVGERVITRGHEALRDGAPVKVMGATTTPLRPDQSPAAATPEKAPSTP